MTSAREKYCLSPTGGHTDHTHAGGAEGRTRLDAPLFGPADTRAGWPGVDLAGTGPAIALRSWQARDLPIFHALLDDPLVWKHMPQRYPAPLTRDEAEQLIAVANLSGHHEVRAVLADGQPVGQVRLEFHDGGRAEVSYWLGRDAWGRGIAARALGLMLDGIETRHPQITRLFARIRPANTGSIRVAEKVGLRVEGDDPADPDWLIYARRTR